MTNQTLPRDPHEFGRIYHEQYIGCSASAEQCAQQFGYANGMSFIIHCRKLGFRLRTHTESLQAIPKAGQPWEWPGDDEDRTRPKPLNLALWRRRVKS